MPNRLYHVNDAVATGLASNEDISDPGYSFTNGLEYANYDNNFSYDEIGNLKRDSSEGIKHIAWTVTGKVKSITRYDGFSKTVNQTTIYPSDLEFLYDATGNRISKIEKTRDENGLKSSANWITTYYTRDAQGNIMSVYKLSNEAQQTTFAQAEVSIYGSSRVGVDNTLTELISPVPQGNVFSNILGKKQYELTNHLGNVLATVSDIKFQQDYNSDNEVDIYTADIITAQDYYPFGMLMPGRTFSNSSYRYGFNGQELDNEVTGVTGSHYTAEFWEYDSRIGRRWNLDPKPTVGISDYACFGDNPIWYSDPLGDKWFDRNTRRMAREARQSFREARRNADNLHDRNEMTAATRELKEMRKHEQVFRFTVESVNPTGAYTSMANVGGENVVDVVVPQVGVGAGSPHGYLMRSFSHELKHGYDFIQGKLSYDPNLTFNMALNGVMQTRYGTGLLYDTEDEVSAFNRGYVFDKSFWGFSKPSDIKDTRIKAGALSYSTLSPYNTNSLSQMGRLNDIRIKEGRPALILTTSERKMTYDQYQQTLPTPEIYWKK